MSQQQEHILRWIYSKEIYKTFKDCNICIIETHPGFAYALDLLGKWRPSIANNMIIKKHIY